METHVRIIGALLTFLSVIHVGFPRYFRWKEELKSLSLINRQMAMVHTFFIAFVVLLIGLLCLTHADDLVQTEFGKIISLGLALFWTLRLFFQLFIYSSRLWRGKMFESVIHVLFTLFWCYMAIVFWMVYLGKEF